MTGVCKVGSWLGAGHGSWVRVGSRRHVEVVSQPNHDQRLLSVVADRVGGQRRHLDHDHSRAGKGALPDRRVLPGVRVQRPPVGGPDDEDLSPLDVVVVAPYPTGIDGCDMALRTGKASTSQPSGTT